MAKTVCIAQMHEGQNLVDMIEALNRIYRKAFSSFVTVVTSDNFMTAVAFEIKGRGTYSERIDDTMGHFSNRILNEVERKGLVLYNSLCKPKDEIVKRELEERGYQVAELDH